MMKKRRHTVTDIVATVYCEQKVVFDRQYGKSLSRSVRSKVALGTFEHIRFQWEGYTRNPNRLLTRIGNNLYPSSNSKLGTDSRCFIASHVYGFDAPETNSLREWRDSVLMASKKGRALVKCYYILSPVLVTILRRSLLMTSLIKRVLNFAIKKIGCAQ